MKKLVLLLTLALSTTAFAQKVGVIDVQRAVASVKAGKKVQSSLKKYYDSKKKELSKEESKLKKLQEKLQKQSAVLSEKAKAKKAQEFSVAVQGLNQKRMQYQKEIQKMEVEKSKPILKNLETIIEAVSKSEELDFTFHRAAAPVYAKNRVDITDKVIKAYDKKFK